MELSLDHTQRLNVIAMLDRLECQGRREAWAVCALQFKLDLDDAERTAIGYRKQWVEGRGEVVLWVNHTVFPPKTYELGDEDIKRISDAMDKYPVILARDRGWWEPLNAQLPGAEQLNGNASVTQAA